MILFFINVSIYLIEIFLTNFNYINASSIIKANCINYNNILSDGTIGFCAGLIDYEIYLMIL